jgi:tetratricopeptide (TPR) repeat protein
LPACLAFFYLAMLPASRLIGTEGSGGSHFADRYAYVPSIGLAILLAFFLQHVAHRISSRTLVRICLPVLLLFTGLTWGRNADWRSEVALFGVEYERGEPTGNTLRWLTGAHLKAGNYARVVKICDDHAAAQKKHGGSTYVQSCATAYEHQQRYEEVERAHLYAIDRKSTRVAASTSLARFYLRRARPLDAEKYFKSAIDWADDPADKALMMAEMVIALNSRSKEQAIIAKGYIEEALRYRPGWDKAEAMLESLQKALNSAQSPLLDLPTPPPPQGSVISLPPREPGSQ